MNDLALHDPEINLKPRDIVGGLARSDADFERKRADYYVLLRVLANVVYRAKLLRGTHLCDAGDFKEWLEELAEAMK